MEFPLFSTWKHPSHRISSRASLFCSLLCDRPPLDRPGHSIVDFLIVPAIAPLMVRRTHVEIAMAIQFSYGAVRESQRRAIFVVRVENAILTLPELESIADRMREKLEGRGEIAADVVVVQGDSKETF